jgi:hypothetical protein
LPLLHGLSPWSNVVLERLKLPVEQLPAGAGAAYQGWPRFTLAQQRGKGFWGLAGDSFFPSPWWLRVAYGEGPSGGGYGKAWLAHQRWLWQQIGHVLARDARQAVDRWGVK